MFTVHLQLNTWRVMRRVFIYYKRVIVLGQMPGILRR